MKTKLVVFDCDGVLIDSEIILHRVASRELTRLGFPLTVDRSIEIFSGVDEENLAKVFHKEFGESLSNEDFSQLLDDVRKAFPGDLQYVENIPQFLNYLNERQVKRCIASNSTYQDIVNCLDHVGIKSYFEDENIFSISKIKPGKPAPDLFLHAANKFNVAPKECIVIEDSVVGIRAAKAANMPVVGFLGATHAKSSWYYDAIVKEGPDAIAQDGYELLDMLDV